MFRYGQLLVSKEDTVLEKDISGEPVVVPKGNKVVVGFDNLAHHIRNGMIQPLGEEVKGYSSTGIIEIVYTYLNSRLPLKDMLDDYDVSAQEFKSVIVEALEEIGLFE